MYLQKARQRYMQNLKLPGFRPGKVPPHLIKQKLNDVEIFRQAHLLVFNKAFQYASSQKASPSPYQQPRVEVKTINHEKYVLLINFALPPNYHIKSYVGFTDIAKVVPKITTADINQQLHLLQSKLAMLTPKKGTVTKGDQVKINFRGFINNEAFVGGNAKDFELEIGSNKLIPGFEDQIIGMKVGEIKKIHVTFPTDYPQPALAGKDADFKVTLNELFNKKLPPIDDKLARDYPDPNVKTLEQLKKIIKTQLFNQQANTAREEFMDNLFRAIAAASNLNIDQQIIDKETRALKKEFVKELNSKNLTLKQYKQRTKINEDYIQKELRAEAQQRIENTLIIQRVQQEEKLKVSPEAIAAAYEFHSKQFNMSVAELKNGILPEEKIKKNILEKLALDFLYDHNGNQPSSVAKKESLPKAAVAKKPKPNNQKNTPKSTASKTAVAKKPTIVKATTSKSAAASKKPVAAKTAKSKASLPATKIIPPAKSPLKK